MPKKPGLRDPSQRKVSSARQPSGLIAKATQSPTQSAGTKSVLDNRSHRTTDGLLSSADSVHLIELFVQQRQTTLSAEWRYRC